MLLALFLYLSLYTFNQRTGYLDELSSHTGLEFVALVLRPGQWIKHEITGFWDRYVDLVGVREENDALRTEMDKLRLDLARAAEDEAELARLRSLLRLSPPDSWTGAGARVMGRRMGPQAALDTILVDKGLRGGVGANAPVATVNGVVGRVVSRSLHAAQVLLLTDPNSRIAVRGSSTRTPGVLAGKGPGEPLELLYVPLNAPLEQGELLVTSGLAGIYPKGLPVARVVSIERKDISLFQAVEAEPLEDPTRLEEVLVLVPPLEPGAEPEQEQGAAQ